MQIQNTFITEHLRRPDTKRWYLKAILKDNTGHTFVGVKVHSVGDIFQYHCVKSVQTRSFSDAHLPAFGLNTERTKYLSVFSPNAGKYRPKKLRIWTLFTQCIFYRMFQSSYFLNRSFYGWLQHCLGVIRLG